MALIYRIVLVLLVSTILTTNTGMRKKAMNDLTVPGTRYHTGTWYVPKYQVPVVNRSSGLPVHLGTNSSYRYFACWLEVPAKDGLKLKKRLS